MGGWVGAEYVAGMQTGATVVHQMCLVKYNHVISVGIANCFISSDCVDQCRVESIRR